MKVTTLPSGSIRVRVYTHSEWEELPDGTKKEHKKYKSFTSKDASAKGKKKLIAEATAFVVEKEHFTNTTITLDEGFRNYVEARKNLLSPATLREYDRIIKNGIPYIGKMQIDKITQEDIQSAINKFSVGHAYKTVKNYRGYISAVLSVYRPTFIIKAKMPQATKNEIYIPTDDEIKAILKAVKGTHMELPVMLAAFGPMRRGEICGLRKNNISGNTVHVCENMVLNNNHEWVIKAPKSYSGDRYIIFPDFVAEKFKDIEDYVVEGYTPAAITCKFEHVLKEAGVKKFRFHDLRHWCISNMYKLGIPSSDIILRSGHGSVAILEQVYLHATQDKIKEMNDKTTEYFNSLMSES